MNGGISPLGGRQRHNAMDSDPQIVAGRRAANQVGLLALAGVATVVLVLILVTWALREVRLSEREVIRVQERTDEVSRTLREALSDALSEQFGYLDDRRPIGARGDWVEKGARAVASLRSVVTTSAELEALDHVDRVFAEAKDAVGNCRDWRLRNDVARAALDTRLSTLRRSIDELGGRAALVEGILALKSATLTKTSPSTTVRQRHANASEVRLELATLAMMVERLRTEADADLLAHHRANLIGPCLARLDFLAPRLSDVLPGTTPSLGQLLLQVRRDLLGEGDPSTGAIAFDGGSGLGLIAERRAMIDLTAELDRVRTAAALAMGHLQQADWEVHGMLDRRKKVVASGLEQILRKDRDALLGVGVICVGALGMIGLSVRRTLLGQVHALVRSNQALDQAYRASQVAAKGLAQQKYALDQHAIVAVTDIEGRILRVNDQFCDLTGFCREDLVGNTHRLVNSGFHPESYFDEMRRVIRRGAVWRGLTCNRRKDGREYFVQQTIVPIHDVDGRIAEFISIQVDVTEDQKRRAELVEAKKLAEAGSRAKSEFLAMMSHEIRTPMNAILGFSNLLEAGPLDQQQREFTRLISESSGALLRIINDILDLSRVEAGKLEVERVEFDLPELVEQVAEMTLGQVESRGLAVGVRLATGSASRVLGDPGRVRQVLLNLVGNAAKFTEAGHLVVEVAPYWPDGIGDLLGQESDGQERSAPAVRVAVSDTGIGIAEEVQARLFQTFTQADNSTTRRFGGTGLGLAISRRLVELMGGRIGMSSRPGEGSVFWFCLPLASPLAQGGPVVRKEGRRILLAQPHPGFAALMSRQLEDWGLPHDRVRSGAEALERLWGAVEEGRPYDCLNIDAVLPGMPPDRLRDAILSDPILKDLKLVLTGTNGGGETFRRLQAAGFDAACLNPTVRTQAWRCLLEEGPPARSRGESGPGPGPTSLGATPEKP